MGDSSGCILLTAKGDICTTLAAGKCVHIANAKTEMYKGSLRLQVFEGNATVEQVSESIGVKVRSSHVDYRRLWQLCWKFPASLLWYQRSTTCLRTFMPPHSGTFVACLLL